MPHVAASNLGLHCLSMSLSWDARFIWWGGGGSGVEGIEITVELPGMITCQQVHVPTPYICITARFLFFFFLIFPQKIGFDIPCKLSP